MTILDVATEYVASGLSIIPLRVDGSKSPAIDSWAEYQTRQPTDQELRQWFARKSGIGIIGGTVSGGLEIFDFDDGALFDPWYQQTWAIVMWLPVVETPSGGNHVFFRCSEIGGNAKIAIDPSREKKTLIETRGQGGYVASAGSPWGIHAKGIYVQVAGPVLPEIPTISPEDRLRLWQAARSFDRRPQADIERIKSRYQRHHLPPVQHDVHPVVDAFNRRAEWADILTGWTSRDGEIWTRPGKSFGTSARVVIAKDGSECLTVFSGNSGPLSPAGSHKTWSKFAAWAAINHGGDWRQAIRFASEVLA